MTTTTVWLGVTVTTLGDGAGAGLELGELLPVGIVDWEEGELEEEV